METRVMTWREGSRARLIAGCRTPSIRPAAEADRRWEFPGNLAWPQWVKPLAPAPTAPHIEAAQASGLRKQATGPAPSGRIFCISLNNEVMPCELSILLLSIVR